MPQSCNGWYWHLVLTSSLAIGGAIASSRDCALAQIAPDATLEKQIIPDATLEKSSVVIPLDSRIDAIDGGTIRGANLFHSFREFNIKAGRGAYFYSPNANIQNILARVTGSNKSEILGTIGTFGNSIPNLFLINPNGIIFGPNASLDSRSVNSNTPGGSFVATTANAVLLGDKGIFSASEPTASNLLTVSPSALFFNNVSKAEIVNRSTATSSILGSPADGLRVPDGRSLLLVGGDVSVDGGRLTAYGGRVELGGVAGSGTVKLRVDGNNLRLNFPDQLARADVSLSNGAVVNASGSGGGEIHLQGRRITLTDGAQVSSSTLGQGRSGDLRVTATDSVKLSGTTPDGFPSALFAETSGTGDAGSLTIATKHLIIQNGANVSTTSRGSTGKGGNLSVTDSDFVELSGTTVDGKPSGLFAQTLGSGDAGSLTITTRQLTALDGAQVVAGTGDDSQGKGGTLTVTALDSVELSGTAPNGQDTSGLFARTRGSGPAGTLTVTTGQLIVRNKAQVTVSGIASGDAGTLEVRVRKIRLDEEGVILAETASGEGGNIMLLPQDLLLLRRGSKISTTAGAGGNGGNITIKTPFIVAISKENSDITANANQGSGGFIQITAQGVFGIERGEQLTRLSNITAFSKKAPNLNGLIQINTPDVDPSRGLVALPAEPVDVIGLIAQGCPASVGQGESKFVITGRGGLPPSPSNTLDSDAIQVDFVTLNPGAENRSSPHVSTNPTVPEPTQIVEAQGWVIGANGEVVLTATAANVTPHSPSMNPATCHTPETSS